VGLIFIHLDKLAKISGGDSNQRRAPRWSLYAWLTIRSGPPEYHRLGHRQVTHEV
jgi:hypothetical protein